MNCDDFREYHRLRLAADMVIRRALLKIAARKLRQQRDADEEGVGALLCAIRLARREALREPR